MLCLPSSPGYLGRPSLKFESHPLGACLRFSVLLAICTRLYLGHPLKFESQIQVFKNWIWQWKVWFFSGNWSREGIPFIMFTASSSLKFHYIESSMEFWWRKCRDWLEAGKFTWSFHIFGVKGVRSLQLHIVYFVVLLSSSAWNQGKLRVEGDTLLISYVCSLEDMRMCFGKYFKKKLI